MDLLPVGRFGPKALTEKLGTITRMLPDGSVGFLRGTCRKDSSANDDDADDVLAIAHGHRHRHHHHHHAEGDDRVPRGAEDGEDEIDLSRFASEKEARAYFKRKLAIFEASMMTPVAANRRLAVRKLELEGGFGEPYGSSVGDSVGPMIDELDCIPPRQLLMYLVRYVLANGTGMSSRE